VRVCTFLILGITRLVLVIPNEVRNLPKGEVSSRFLVASLLGMTILTAQCGSPATLSLIQTRSSIFKLPAPPFQDVLNCFSMKPAS